MLSKTVAIRCLSQNYSIRPTSESSCNIFKDRSILGYNPIVLKIWFVRRTLKPHLPTPIATSESRSTANTSGSRQCWQQAAKCSGRALKYRADRFPNLLYSSLVIQKSKRTQLSTSMYTANSERIRRKLTKMIAPIMQCLGKTSLNRFNWWVEMEMIKRRISLEPKHSWLWWNQTMESLSNPLINGKTWFGEKMD